MATVTVKNIPDELYERLKKRAEANRRSINREIILCIEQAVTSTKADPETLLANARKLRAKVAPGKVSNQEIDQAKKAGRL